MYKHDSAMYEEEKTRTHISFTIYRVHAAEPTLFFVDTSAPHSWIRYMAFERIFRNSGRKSIPIIDSKLDFKFGDTLIR